MSSDLLTRLEKYCCGNSLIEDRDGIIVAVSGGADSVVLLHLLNQLKEKFHLRLRVAHVNHRLRGRESEGDETFVRTLAMRYGIPCSVRKVDTTGYAKGLSLSLQEAARDLRYEFFRELVKERNGWKVATAHNANDNAETILLNLCRGSGLQGLTGIPLHRKDVPVIRPLLFATRVEVETYARENKLRFRTDSSNEQLHYRRNLVRRRILPLLEKYLNPEVVSALNRTSEILSRLEHMLDGQVNKHLKRMLVKKSDSVLAVDAVKLTGLDAYLQELVVQKLAQTVAGVPLEAEKVEKVLRLVMSPSGKHLDLSKNLSVYRDRGAVVFMRPKVFSLREVPVKVNKRYEFGDYVFSSKPVRRRPALFESSRAVEYVDADRVDNRLRLRNWRDGDWFVPLGMRGRKKLSDFLTDEKIPLYRKRSIPVLESRGNIVWVCGVRLDNRFRLSPETRSVLKLEFHEKES